MLLVKLLTQLNGDILDLKAGLNDLVEYRADV